MIHEKIKVSPMNNVSQEHYGFAMVSALLFIFLMGLSMLSFLSKVNMRDKDNLGLAKDIRKQRVELSVKKMMNHKRCLCHFDPAQNTSVSVPLGIDTVNFHDIPLGIIRKDCDFSSSDNVLIQNGSALGKGFAVDKIKVTNLRGQRGSYRSYLGEILITYSSQNNRERPPSPSSIPLVFVVNDNMGTDENRPVLSCWSAAYSTPKELALFDESCYFVDEEADTTQDPDAKSKGRILVGCEGTVGTTNAPRPPTTTAFGFQAGKSLTDPAHIGNTYFGYQAGMNHQGDKTTMIGYMAGKMSDSAKSISVRKSNFIGYRAGESLIEGENLHFVGAEAGLNTVVANNNIFVGASAGKNHTKGNRNVFLGYAAGRDGFPDPASSDTIDDNILVGYKAGLKNRGDRNIFIGSQAGEANIDGSGSVVMGFQSGQKNSSIDKSVLIGYEVGKKSQGGEYSVFIGHRAGRENTGDKNTFVGNSSGLKNKSGQENAFSGHESGKSNTTGSQNTFIGASAGQKNTSGSYNTFVGKEAGAANTTGDANTMIGMQAGAQNTTGSNNIYIGFGAANISDTDTYKTGSNQFVVGNSTNKTWLTGEMTFTGDLFVEVGGAKIKAGSAASSRFLKKNIRPVTDFRKYLDDILDTPLFTYQYKDPMNHPHKTRMGIISEELPEHLQIKSKVRILDGITDEISRPDWPSIYGYFWAGLKALHQIKTELEEDLLSKIQDFLSRIQSIKEKQVRFIEVWTQNKKEMSSIQSKLHQVNREMEQVQREIVKTRKDFDRDWEELMARISSSRSASSSMPPPPSLSSSASSSVRPYPPSSSP